MYCPSCGTENSDETQTRFCRSCGADLRAVSRAMNRSLPVRLAASLDAYFENRFQQNLHNGVLNAGVCVSPNCRNGLFDFRLDRFWNFHVGTVGDLDSDRCLGHLDLSTQSLPIAKNSQLAGINPKLIPETPSPTSVTEQTTRHLDTTRKD